ncbi:hypothetical protein [Persicobacter sp. CCB-QB2]|uniref:hypothetical protein n=1 Tax=Persicobacter sp. CCB-QB2 TaxID=1561025 RepID=UPI0012FA5CB8|nr:hypothetical protein [Persicobacter sp. CCB-QB2]
MNVFQTWAQVTLHLIDGQGLDPIDASLILINDRPYLLNEQGAVKVFSPKSVDSLCVEVSGYQPRLVMLPDEGEMVLELIPITYNLKEFVLEGNHNEVVGQVEIFSTESLSNLAPQFMGEFNIERSLQSLPGVMQTGDHQSGMYIRGGHRSESMSYLNDVPLLFTNHFFGISGPLHAQMVEAVYLYKDYFPMAYDGVSSGFLNIDTFQAVDDRQEVSAGVGIISSDIYLKIPLINDRLNLSVGGRRTYYDLIANFYNQQNSNHIHLPDYRFYDFDINLSWNIKTDQFFHINYLNSRDDLFADFGSRILSGQWSGHHFSAQWLKSYSNQRTLTFITGFNLNKFNHTFDFLGKERVEMENGLDFVSHKIKYEEILNRFWKYEAGIDFVTEGGVQNLKSTSDEIEDGDDVRAYEALGIRLDAYLESTLLITNWLNTDLALRYGWFATKEKAYNLPSIRFRTTLDASDRIQFYLSYMQSWQHRHVIPGVGMDLPMDQWFFSDKFINPIFAQHYNFSFKYQWLKCLRSSLNFFFIDKHNISDTKSGLYAGGIRWQDAVAQGDEVNYGLESQQDLHIANLELKLSYTYLFSERKIEGINQGHSYRNGYSPQHQLNINGQYQLNKNWSFGALWFLSTGQKITLPESFTLIQGLPGGHPSYDFVPIYGERNNFDLPISHRLDISIDYSKKRRWGDYTISLSVFNVYNQANPYFINLELITFEDRPSVVGAKTESLLPIMPSLSYRVKF